MLWFPSLRAYLALQGFLPQTCQQLHLGHLPALHGSTVRSERTMQTHIGGQPKPASFAFVALDAVAYVICCTTESAMAWHSRSEAASLVVRTTV